MVFLEDGNQRSFYSEESENRIQARERKPFIFLKENENLSLKNINPLLLTFKEMEYAARGPVIMRTIEIEEEMARGNLKKFTSVVKANLGDAHAVEGQKPITFLRQVLALVSCPSLMKVPGMPKDVIEKAESILRNSRGSSIGSYSDSVGMKQIRSHVAQYIQNRDGGDPSSPNDIFLSNGASEGIRACLKLLKSNENINSKSGVLCPIPEYPLYRATLKEYDILNIGYYLDEENNWGINITDLNKIIAEASKRCDLRAIVVINPGNPTGHVLKKENMEEIIKLAYRKKLAIFADEVYQDNTYNGVEFHSFKKVLMSMDAPYNTVELFSFYSCSKGYICECGLRGAYCEVLNVDQEVKSVLYASLAAKLCPNLLGQVAVDCAVDGPKEGSESYETYIKEKSEILSSLGEKASLIQNIFNSLPGVKCSQIDGAMYAFPKLELPEKFIKISMAKNIEPDVAYALELVEESGICVVPGSGMGQMPGTYHFRITILPPKEKLVEVMEKFKEFHLNFMLKYSN